MDRFGLTGIQPDLPSLPREIPQRNNNVNMIAAAIGVARGEPWGRVWVKTITGKDGFDDPMP